MLVCGTDHKSDDYDNQRTTGCISFTFDLFCFWHRYLLSEENLFEYSL